MRTTQYSVTATGTEEQFSIMMKATGIKEDDVEGSETGFDGDLVRYHFVVLSSSNEAVKNQLSAFVTVESIK